MGRLIRRVLAPPTSRTTLDGHLSRDCVTAALQRSTRRLDEQPVTSPVRPCSGRGLPSRPDRSGRWWSLTPPFHPYPGSTSRCRPWRSAFCCTFSRVAPGGCYPPPCSSEPGRSSAPDPEGSRDATVLPAHSRVRSYREPAVDRRRVRTADQMPDSAVRTRMAWLSGQSSTVSGSAARMIAISFSSSFTPLALETPPWSRDAPYPYRCLCLS